MRFDLRKFARLMLLVAIVGIVGNQIVLGVSTLIDINTHNDAVAIVHSHKEPASSEEAIRNYS